MSCRNVALAAMIALVTAMAPAPSAIAQPVDTPAAVERLFGGEIEAGWLAEAFAAEVPPDRLAALIAQMTAEFGPLQGVEGTGGRLTVRLERAEVPTQVALDGEGRIVGLFFEAPIPVAGDVAQHVAAIAALPGRTSVLVLSDGVVAAAHEPHAVLAVGSAAKLAILKALDGAVAAGRLAPDTVVALDPAWRSLPTGILQTWPEGTPVTIATLAALMISQSDNTATDALIDIVGREAVEAITPRNTPFLTTAELFKLMARGNAGLAGEWQAGDADARRRLIPQLSGLPLPEAAELDAADGVEWYMSAAELCALMEDVADHPAMHINPGLASRDDWASIAYKGGSDFGVLNFTTRVVGARGSAHCVVATWNRDGTLAAEQLAPPYRGILRALAKGSTESD